MLDKFISENTGRVLSVDNVPANAGQSPQLLAAWCQYIGLPFQWADAYAWWDDSDFTFLEHWEKIVNDRKNADQLPKRGDIVIFDGSLPGSAGYGHGSIFVENVGANSWIGFDANWGGKSAHLQSHNWSYVLGWFTPKQPGVLEGAATPLASEAPSLSYDIERIEQQTVTLKTDAPLYDLNNVSWQSFQHDVHSHGAAGQDVVVNGLARHRLGGAYYLPDTKKPYGYRVSDCDNHDGTGEVALPPEETITTEKKSDTFPKAPLMAPSKTPIQIEKEIPRYGSMGDAINNVNSTGTIPPGTYYLYKSLDGMQCLTTEPGNALGWWMNPDDLMSDEEKLKMNWRASYRPFRDQYGAIAPRYYRALNEDVVPDLEEKRPDLKILFHQPILIRGWYTGPDGVVYGRPDDCVSKSELQWYGVRRSNLERIPDPTMVSEPDEPEEMIIDDEPLPTLRERAVSILPSSVARVFDIVKPKA